MACPYARGHIHLTHNRRNQASTLRKRSAFSRMGTTVPVKLDVTKWQKRVTGLEPATFSLGS